MVLGAAVVAGLDVAIGAPIDYVLITLRMSAADIGALASDSVGLPIPAPAPVGSTWQVEQRSE